MNPPTPERIIRFMTDEAGRPVRARELAHLMGVPDRDYPAFRDALKRLLDEGRIVRLKRGRLAPPDPLNLVVGTVVVRRGGHMFCRSDEREGVPPEIFLRPRERMTALDGDRVMVRLHPDRDGPSPEGEVIRVISRGSTPILGVFRRAKHFWYVTPEQPHPLREIYIPTNAARGVEVGQQVMVVITDWEFPDQTPTGKIIQILGFPDEPGVDILRIIAEYQLPQSFPKDVLAEVRQFPEEIDPADLTAREDFRSLVTFTIDPADAKDHDDAVSLEPRDGGWRLGVHIADVSHYVREGSALDREAYERGTSVYLVDRVIPMLPPRLSNDLCSLRPKRDRLTFSCMIDLSADGELLKYRFCRSIIHSRAKLSYDEVSDFFYKGEISKVVKPHETLLSDMRTVSQNLRRRRFKNGSLDLDVPEAKVILDDDGNPVRIEIRRSDDSHQLVEEFMLIANQCAAHQFLRRNRPCLFRVHAPPDQTKMEEFANFATSLGYRFSVKGGVNSQLLARLLDRLKDDPRREMIHQILLRSLMKAVYQPENVGHFGLAFPHYAHFTSPIRRYPDLWLHRHLAGILDGTWTTAQQNITRANLPALGKKTSERERAAEEAERESVRIKQLEFLETKVGDEFDGQVSGFLEFGVFVSLAGIGADGLIRFSSIDDDYYTWEREAWRVRGRRTGRTFNLGDKIRVRLIRTDSDRQEIDLVLAETAASDELAGSIRRRSGRGRRQSKV
ncbi:MAG: ribonuclease R [candidate division Zixibacteria bacterium]|nr:ribonuclease R [candidate division Zixibacteria bacterium]